MPSTDAKRFASAIIVACSMVLASGMAPPSESPAEFSPPDAQKNQASVALASVADPAGLQGNRYGLGVVPLPPPPAQRMALQGTAVSACPEVRAVVLGDSDVSSFVVVGEQVVHRGQAFSWGGSQLQVQDLAARQVTFMRGDVAVRCALPKLSMR